MDPVSHAAEVWHPNDTRPAVEEDELRWRVRPEAAELVIDLTGLFANLPGVPG